jgi:hypothetical protein
VGRQSNGFHTRDPILTQVCFLRHSAANMPVGQEAKRVCGSAALGHGRQKEPPPP